MARIKRETRIVRTIDLTDKQCKELALLSDA